MVMRSSTSYTLGALADLLGATVIGDANRLVTGLNTLALANADQITFLDNPKYQSQLPSTQAAAVILAEAFAGACPTNALVVAEPYVAYAKTAQLFWVKPKPYPGIHPTAIVDPSACIADQVSIGPYTVIGAGVTLYDHCIIGAHCVIGDDCQIGAHAELAARVTLYHQVTLGARCMVHSGAVIGSDGFGFAPHQASFEKIPQLGGVVIGDDVEIGANTTIDRGALNDTVIERGVKLDNQIQIGHNVKIGEHTVIAGCTAIAGSSEIGKHCMIGGAACVSGHVKIADYVMLAGMSAATNSITQPGVYASGTGLLPRADWQKSVVRFRQLNEIAKTVSALKKSICPEE
jgi:UDP-3-O-[3-hydroxymyristoyl] glucosamine N-acyltransferase